MRLHLSGPPPRLPAVAPERGDHTASHSRGAGVLLLSCELGAHFLPPTSQLRPSQLF